VNDVEPMHDTEPKPSRPTRTCAGCQKRADAPLALVRVVLGQPEAQARGARGVVVDVASSAFGRGAHVHPDAACIKKACAGGFARAFRCPIVADAAALREQIIQGCNRRLEGLLTGARRARLVAIGEEATSAMGAGAPLAILASDAGANATKAFSWAIAEGRAVAWKDKATLGSLLGRDEIAAVVLKNAGIASEFMRVRAVASSAAADGKAK
jgi:predicted RNA-binding protein YlxR (DUF448 family)